MVKKYIDSLTAEERAELEQFTTTGRGVADQMIRARILLKADRNQGLAVGSMKRLQQR